MGKPIARLVWLTGVQSLLLPTSGVLQWQEWQTQNTQLFTAKRMKQLPCWSRCTGVLLQVKLSSNDGFPTFIRHSCRSKLLFIWSCNNCGWLPSRVAKNNHIQHLISENGAGLYSKVGVAILEVYLCTQSGWYFCALILNSGHTGTNRLYGHDFRKWLLFQSLH